MAEVIGLLGDLAGAPVPVLIGPSQRGDVTRTGAERRRRRRRLGVERLRCRPWVAGACAPSSSGCATGPRSRPHFRARSPSSGGPRDHAACSWSARATSGCRWRCGPSRSATTCRARRRRAAASSGCRDGDSFVEDVSPGRRRRLRSATGRYRPTTDPDDGAGFDIAVVSVPTPLRAGRPDLSYIEDAADVARAARCGRACSSSSSRRPTRAPPTSSSCRSSSAGRD